MSSIFAKSTKRPCNLQAHSSVHFNVEPWLVDQICLHLGRSCTLIGLQINGSDCSTTSITNYHSCIFRAWTIY